MTKASVRDDRRTYELTIITEIAQALNGSTDLNQALQTTLGLVADLLGLETGWIWLLNEETGASYLAAEQNLPPALAQNQVRMEGSCYCLDSYRAGDMEGAANINVVSCSRLSGLVDETGGLTYHASVPLYARGSAESTQPFKNVPPANLPPTNVLPANQLGVLNVASNDWRELSSDDLRLLHTVGDMLGIAIERARLFDQSQVLGALTERNRLAREIHDTLAQGFAAISLQMDTVDALLEGSLDAPVAKEKLVEIVRQARQTAQDNLNEARRSVMDLRAAPLEGSTLRQAIQQLVDSSAIEGDPKITIQSTGDDAPLPPAIESGLYRITQETLTNIHNHAHASVVTINLHVMPEQVMLSIEDDGIGFDPSEVSYNRYGITGMNERAKLLGGTFQLESSPNQGTLITVKV